MSNPNMNDLRKKIESAINSASAENGSDAPDFILAEYLTDCLAAFNKAAMAREKWYGRPLPEPCCPFFEEHPRKMDEEYDEEEHRRLLLN